MICVWCRKPLRFAAGLGWIHEASGKLYETRIDADGVERDDHCALPMLDPPQDPRRAVI